VLKSLFEEQVMADLDKAIQEAIFLTHTEAEDYFVSTARSHYREQYFDLVQAAKKAVSIPVVASVNCITAETWFEYAKGFQTAGADALELNVFVLPSDPAVESRQLEAHYLQIASRICASVALPVAMKISSHFTGLAHAVKTLSETGVKALVLFNRFYRPDIDIDKLKLTSASIFSAPQEMALSLHWITLMAGRVACDLVANTGIHDGRGVIKQLLAGAHAAELCSAVQKKGPAHIRSILAELERWMDRHSFGSIAEFRGMLSRERAHEPRSYERSQYLKGIAG
jgi:dihydroorotate dehydrogenase (fumarate)